MDWFGSLLKTAVPIAATVALGPQAGLATKAVIGAMDNGGSGGETDFAAAMDEVSRGLITQGAGRLINQSINENREEAEDLLAVE